MVLTSARSSIRVAVFAGGGPIALSALDVLHRRHHVVAVVRAASATGPWNRARAAVGRAARRVGFLEEDPIDVWARGAGVPSLTVGPEGDTDAARRLTGLHSDFGCIATFPVRVPDAWIAASGASCINLHTSLLPRHRGRDPLFWTYHAGDPEGGVTTHLAVHDFDSGPLFAQRTCPIGRGEAVTEVHARYASMGAELLADTVAGLAEGAIEGKDQNEAAATRAPGIVRGRQYCELEKWGAEQAWHFLAGLMERYRDPLPDTSGELVYYRGVEGWEARDPLHPPGSVVPRSGGWDAWATDGLVRLVPTPLTVSSDEG